MDLPSKFLKLSSSVVQHRTLDADSYFYYNLEVV